MEVLRLLPDKEINQEPVKVTLKGWGVKVYDSSVKDAVSVITADGAGMRLTREQAIELSDWLLDWLIEH